MPHYLEKFNHNISFYAKHKSLNFIYLTISFLSYTLYYSVILEAFDVWLLTKVISNPHLIGLKDEADGYRGPIQMEWLMFYSIKGSH